MFANAPLLSVGNAAPDITLTDDLNQPTRLSDLWKRQPLALIFVRHSGCTFCLGHAASIRESYPTIQAAGGDVALVSMDEPPRLHDLKQKQRLPFVCLSDPKQDGYRAFQCPRGGLRAVIGPRVWWKGFQSLFRHGLGAPHGDVMQLPSSFVIDQSGTIQFAHRSTNSAEWASPEELIEAFQSLLAPA